MPKVFVACKFRPEDARTYTYEWEGETLNPGDIVKVADNRSDGWKRVTVVSVTNVAPPFVCKPILGLYNPDLEGASAMEGHDADGLPKIEPLDFKLPF